MRNKPGLLAGMFLLCQAVKDFEFLVLQTDRTALAENILCKWFAILAVAVCLRRLRLGWADIGLRRRGVLRGAAFGLALGAVTFAAAYGAEYLVLRGMGLHPRLEAYISNFALAGQNVTGLSWAAVGVCLAGNVFNVWAEEGLFRGLLFRLGREALSDRAANFLQAALFGAWHVVTVAVWVKDGLIGVPAACAMALGYVALAGILGYEWGLCALLTGTLWTGMFEHFFNNFIGNALHMVTETGADELQIARVVLSNVLSLALVLAMTALKKRRGRMSAAQRPETEEATADRRISARTAGGTKK